MKKNLIGFTTSDGQKHLGYYIPVVNPCAEYWEPDSLVKLYTDEYGTEYRDVIKEFKVDDISCYYWDKAKRCYQLLSSPQPSTLPQRTGGLFAKDLITNEHGIYMHSLRTIREWIILNTKCSMPVYIDERLVIHSEGTIRVSPEAIDGIPDYIRFESK